MYRKSHFLGFLFLVAALLLVVAAPRPVAAVGPTVKWVDAAAGSDANDGNSEATAYATLQQALNNSESGLADANRSFIYVKNGTYSSAGYANTCEGIPGAVYVHNLDWLTIQAAAGHEPVVKPPVGIMSVVVEGADHLVVDNLDSDQTVALTDNWNVCDSDDLTLRNSTFQGGSDGIDVHTALTAMLIENNTFTNIVDGDGDEVLDFTDEFTYSGVVIQDNDFINNYRQITIIPDAGGSANNFLIQRNWMNGTSPEEAIRLRNASNIDIINNVILNSMQEGVYVDTGCADIDIVHNTFFNNSLQTGPKLGEIRTNVSSASIKISNNIVHGNGTNPAIVASVPSLPGEDYNLFYNYVPAGSFTTFGPNSMSGLDPLFVNTTAGSEDLHLTFYSPAIESGLPSAISDDKDKGPRPNPTGTDPDRGAYEFVAGTITVTKETNPDGGLGFTFTLEPDTHPFVDKWGSFGANDGEFDHPMGMAVDGSGNVYVVDHYNHRVQKFDDNGVYLTQWGSFGAGNSQFDYPSDVAVDGSGNVYIADYNNSRIQKFNSNGAYQSQWGSYGSGNGELYGPYGVAVDGLGNVYVADTYNNRIQKFDGNGAYQTQWGIYGSGNGEFYYPYGVEVDESGNVYVADTYNHRVQKFDSNGGYLTQWGGYGGGNGLFSYPAGLAIDGFGKVYVTDTNSLVQKFDDDGTFLMQWGGFGSVNSQFAYPYSVDVDEAGYVYVSDTYNHRIQKFGPTSIVLDDDESYTFTRLPAGNYTLSEVAPLPAGWSLDSATCDNLATDSAESIAPSNIPVANGDQWVCTFTNVYTPPPANTCAVGEADSLYTDILGEGMGSPRKHRTKAKVVIPNWQNVEELYGQMSAKAMGLSNNVRFTLPGPNNYVQVDSITSPADHDAGNFWYGATLPAPVKYVTGRWFLQGSGSKRHIPRAITLYTTYHDPAHSYVNVWDTFDGAEGEVHWDAALGWAPYREIVVPMAAPLGETALHVEVALVDNDKDARPVWITVEAGGATQTQKPTGPNAGDQLNLMNFDLVGVDAGADEIVIKVYSPSPIIDGVEGDSAAVVGMAGYYRCEAIP
ncbi:conserved exported protein of unknown function [Candidatus Promineifilum breve]|uniref:Uncharacterized protein n=1 Tax=Candidatus Promineifilum breve TaxID=1806508 RepID=A0A160T773_9CHLR|nr:right-handed parallel beta-helix repeat-containing protein [Candidatus Promineifilum breve]CUS06286.1 conserved exported protein of unknown function [Candidatus Promineifilum breve]